MTRAEFCEAIVKRGATFVMNDRSAPRASKPHYVIRSGSLLRHYTNDQWWGDGISPLPSKPVSEWTHEEKAIVTAHAAARGVSVIPLRQASKAIR